jgi:hypothetical protein
MLQVLDFGESGGFGWGEINVMVEGFEEVFECT